MTSKTKLFLTLLFGFSVFFGCDEETPPPGGCPPLYTHVFENEMNFHLEYDDISLFFAAGEPYSAPIGVTHIINNDLLDSLIINIYAYGQSHTINPDPNIDYVWKSDSLIIWFSWFWPPYIEDIDLDSGYMDRTPPCPMDGYYMIDYVLIQHSEDLNIKIDEYVKR